VVGVAVGVAAGDAAVGCWVPQPVTVDAARTRPTATADARIGRSRCAVLLTLLNVPGPRIGAAQAQACRPREESGEPAATPTTNLSL
jgi:hypothetical protein